MSQSYLVVPDLHLKFHDPQYLSMITRILVEEGSNLSGIIQLGDFLDNPQCSDFAQDPSRKNELWDDIGGYNMLLDVWESLLPQGAVVHQLEGNHEDRLRRYLWTKAPKVHGMVPSWPSLLKFPERHARRKLTWHWHPLAKWSSCVIGDTVFHHGKFFDRHVAVNNLDRYPGKNLVTGHTHRLQTAYRAGRWSVSLGHGSDAEKTMHEPVPTTWTQAFGIYTVHEGKGHIEVVAVDNGSCVFRGQPLKVGY